MLQTNLPLGPGQAFLRPNCPKYSVQKNINTTRNTLNNNKKAKLGTYDIIMSQYPPFTIFYGGSSIAKFDYQRENPWTSSTNGRCPLAKAIGLPVAHFLVALTPCPKPSAAIAALQTGPAKRLGAGWFQPGTAGCLENNGFCNRFHVGNGIVIPSGYVKIAIENGDL